MGERRINWKWISEIIVSCIISSIPPKCLVKYNFHNWIIFPLARLHEKNILMLFSYNAVLLGESFCLLSLSKYKLKNNSVSQQVIFSQVVFFKGSHIYIVLTKMFCTFQVGYSITIKLQMFYSLLNMSSETH